jgi:hypothetical protein
MERVSGNNQGYYVLKILSYINSLVNDYTRTRQAAKNIVLTSTIDLMRKLRRSLKQQQKKPNDYTGK